uniref:Uncharacterized protein n=1 Tax=Anguilla anguilla TaxID=7936 RepID=A0A0E9RZG3_ANGAN
MLHNVKYNVKHPLCIRYV